MEIKKTIVIDASPEVVFKAIANKITSAISYRKVPNKLRENEAEYII